MKSKEIPEIISKSKDELLHVFFVASPILGIVSRTIIDNFKIRNKNVLLISLRDTPLILFNHKNVKLTPTKLDRYLEKLFFDSPGGRKVLKNINFQNKEFLIYSGWAYREVNYLLRKRNCKGHIYIEEGQGSYMNFIPYDIKKMTLIDKIKFNWRNRVNPIDGKGVFFRDDVKAYIGLSQESFPKAPDSKKYILKNLYNIKGYYKPKIFGQKTIGLTSSNSRLPKIDDWKKMLYNLIQNLPEKSLLKPHPSFTTNKLVFSKFKNLFDQLNNKDIILLGSDVFLEIEMMYEKKNIIGPQSSLFRYANLIGSNYKQINL